MSNRTKPKIPAPRVACRAILANEGKLTHSENIQEPMPPESAIVATTTSIRQNESMAPLMNSTVKGLWV